MASDDIEHYRAWAKGSYGLEAAVVLLARVRGGRFLTGGWPWLREDDGTRWIDFAAAARPDVPLSGGEGRLLRLAASFAGEAEVNLEDVLSGLDRAVVDVVLAAVAHTAGTHQHTEFLAERGSDGAMAVGLDSPRVDPGALHTWPDEPGQEGVQR